MKEFSIIKIKNCPACKSKKRLLKFIVKTDKIPSKIVRCNDCNLVYNAYLINFREKGKNLPYHLDSEAEYKNDYKRWNQYAKDYLSKLKDEVNGENFLEIGTGPGFFLNAANQLGFESLGIEPYYPSYIFAKKQNLNVINSSLSEVVLNKKFDLILAIEVIEHFIDPIKEFEKMLNLLEDDGLIVLQTGCENSLEVLLKGRNRFYYYYDHHIYYTPRTLNFILKKVGLKIVKVRSGIMPLKTDLKKCLNIREKLFVFLTHFLRLLTFNKPILSSMTVYVKKDNKKVL